MTILGVKVNTLRGHYGHIWGRKWPLPGAEVAMREAEAMRMGLGRGFLAVTESTEATERLQKDHDEAEERSKGDETHGGKLAT